MAAEQATRSASLPSPLNSKIAVSERDGGEGRYPLSQILNLRKATIDWIDIAQLLGFDYAELYHWARDNGLEQRRFPQGNPRNFKERLKRNGRSRAQSNREEPPIVPSRLEAAIASAAETEVPLDRQPVRGLKPQATPEPQPTRKVAGSAKPPKLNGKSAKTQRPQHQRPIIVGAPKPTLPSPQPRRFGTPGLIFIPADLEDMMAVPMGRAWQQKNTCEQESRQTRDLASNAASEPDGGSVVATRTSPTSVAPSALPPGKQRAQRAPELSDVNSHIVMRQVTPSRVYRF
jgi:hypothetical protein